ncbi:MAG: Ig-like domain-containing protein [Spirochaetia bacterium]|nr:Ig-like domain-containing protein [Spirochaetia bacterium]
MKRLRTIIVVLIVVASAGLLMQCGDAADLLGTVEDRVAEATTEPVHSTIVNRSPEPNSIEVLKTTNISISYENEIEENSLEYSSPDGNVTIDPYTSIDCSVTNSDGQGTIVIDPQSDLIPGETYTVRINRNSSGGKVFDTDGVNVAADSFVFTILPLPIAPSGGINPADGSTVDPIYSSTVIDWPNAQYVDFYQFVYDYDDLPWGPITLPLSPDHIYSYYDLSELPQGDLPENTEIIWYVLAYNSSGLTKFPSSNWIFTTGTYAPSIPTILLASY